MSPAVGAALVQRLGRHLSARSHPRLTVLAALVVSGGGGALFSALSLRSGLVSMPVRYGVAVGVGYLVFLGCIRLWIAYERRTHRPGRAASFERGGSGSGGDIGDLVADIDLSPGRAAARGTANLFAGGQSGGGGAGAGWAALVPDPAGTSTVTSGAGHTAGGLVGSVTDALDADDLGWLLLAAAAACGGLLAVCWVVWVAPVLLAEVALDAAVVTTAYRKMRARDIESWTTAVVRRTWLPAGALALLMVVAGWALQHVAPEAHSIGGVIRKVLG